MEGKELTVAYFNDLHNDEVSRRETCKRWMFTCKCERCLRWSMGPQLSKFSKQYHDLIDAGFSESFQKMGKKRKRSAVQELAVATEEIEAVIQSLGRALLPKQPGWIRSAFLLLYTSKHKLAMTGNDSQSRIGPLKVFIDSMKSVDLTPQADSCAAMLLTEAKDSYSKGSQPYKDTLDRVLGMCRVLFGNQPDTVLLNHVKARIPADLQ